MYTIRYEMTSKGNAFKLFWPNARLHTTNLQAIVDDRLLTNTKCLCNYEGKKVAQEIFKLHVNENNFKKKEFALCFYKYTVEMLSLLLYICALLLFQIGLLFSKSECLH